MTRKELLSKYEEVLRDEIYGYTVETNENAREGGILLVGLNPSNNDSEPEHEYRECTGDFWNPKHVMMGKYDSRCAYIDLFPIREGSQTKFEKEVSIELKGKLLSIIQDFIEELHPRLIISVNKSSQYYWGFKKVKKDCAVKSFEDEYDKVWMGYEFKRIKPSPLSGRGRKDYWNFYKVTGIVPSAVNKWRKTTSLVEHQDSYYLQYRQHKDANGGEVADDRRLTPDDIRTLVEWIDLEWGKSLLS